MKTALGYESGGTARLNEQLGYTYDAAQNLNFRTNNALVQTFNNNSLNELTTVTRSGTLTVAGNTTTAATNVTVNALTAARYADKTWAKDGFTITNGNNTFTAIAQNSAGVTTTNTSISYLPTPISLIYDLNGNLRTNGNQILEYDDENRLVTNYVAAAWMSEFTYDGANRCRIQREYAWDAGTSGWNKTNEVRLVYDGSSVIQERDTNNVPKVIYTRVGLSLLSRTDNAAGTHAYYHADGNRNTTALINANQLIVAKYLYDPFGRTLAISGPLADANVYRFASQRYHANSGLVLYLRRAYSPDLQRFVNRDPIGEAGGQNLFGFVGNNPISGFDPLGLCEDLSWYDRLALWAHENGEISKDWINDTTPWWLAGFFDTAIDLGTGLATTPYALGHFGEGTGKFRADPTWENSIGLVGDFNIAMSFALPMAARTPTPTTATQLEFDFVKGDLSGKLTSFNSIAKTGTVLAEEIGILRQAARGTGNYGLGSANAADATRLGKSWVGEGYALASDGKTLISADGTKVFRPPSPKSSPYAKTGVQANFERRIQDSNGKWSHTSNGHLDITN